MIEVIKNNDQVILIVEDEGALSGVLQNKLTRHGFVVEVASDGIEGLEKMKTLQPKLVLLDLIMPNKNGFQVLEEAKADQNTKNIAIVIFFQSQSGRRQGTGKKTRRGRLLGEVGYGN